MEAFSLLKYWRGNGGGGGVGVVAGDAGFNTRSTTGTTTIVTAAVTNQENETDEEEDVGNDDDGPFFDLEFAVPDEDVDGEIDGIHQCQDIVVNGVEEEEEEEEDGDDVESTGSDDGDGESEFKFTLSSGSNDGRTDQNLALSPSDDLFFKGTLVPIEPSSLVLNSSSEQNSKPQFPVSLLKSATKFRVFMLGLKKSKSATSTTAAAEKTESNRSVSASASTSPKQQQKQESEPKQQQSQQESKFFTVKFKVEEVPIVSLFTRDTSRSASSNNSNKLLKQNSEESAAAAAAAAASSEEKRFSKEVVQKYLKKVKPLYIRVSKRYGEKLRFSGQLSLNSAAKTVPPQPSSATQKSSPATAKSAAAVQTEPEGDAKATEAPANNVKSQKQVNLNLPAGLRVVRKHLGKSRSASSAVAAAPSTGPVSSRRRDDSLLQQQDGIQSAILHCKRSFNASRDSENLVISRCASDSSNEKSTDVARSCAEKVKKEARVKSSS